MPKPVCLLKLNRASCLGAFQTWPYACRDVAVLTGAGCSTESNIPDYRGPGGAYSSGFKPMTHQQVSLVCARQVLASLRMQILCEGILPYWDECSQSSCVDLRLIHAQSGPGCEYLCREASRSLCQGLTVHVSCGARHACQRCHDSLCVGCSLYPTSIRRRATGPAPLQAGTSTVTSSQTLDMMLWLVCRSAIVVHVQRLCVCLMQPVCLPVMKHWSLCKPCGSP